MPENLSTWRYIPEPLSERPPEILGDEESDSVNIQVSSTCVAVARFKSYGSTGLAFAGNGDLFVTFVSDGRRYVYRDFPLIEFQSLRVSVSKGGFFNRNIRMEYEYEELYLEE